MGLLTMKRLFSRLMASLPSRFPNRHAQAGDAPTFTPPQQAARREWQSLCFTLERLQVKELCESCVDKVQFAKTYQTYSERFEQMAAEVRRAVGDGDYSFFTQRGIASEMMTPTLADRLLKDWRNAIALKQSLAEKGFWCRFAEEIDVFLNQHRNALRVAMAESLHPTSAIFALGGLDATVRLSGTAMLAEKAASGAASAGRELAPRESAS